MLLAIVHALEMAGIMAWEILWALILGFSFSAIIQAVVSKEEMSSLLPDDRPGTLVKRVALAQQAPPVRMLLSLWHAPCFAKEQTLPHRWAFSWRQPTWFLNSAFSWPY